MVRAGVTAAGGVAYHAASCATRVASPSPRSSSLALAALPAYPGAVELAADAPAAGMLAEALRQDAAARAAAGPGGTMGQRCFRLPEATGWAEARAFYAKTLEAAGWKLGEAGGVTAAVTANVLGLGNPDGVRSASWSRGTQTLTLRGSAGPPAELVLSLATR